MSKGSDLLQEVARGKDPIRAIDLLNSSERFFYEHDGYSYDPKIETKEQGKARCARQSAMYEALAVEQGLIFEWVDDLEGCIGCDCGSSECPCFTGDDHEVYGCVVYADGHKDEVLDSLWGICEPSAEYRRVVEANLAGDRLSRGLWAAENPV